MLVSTAANNLNLMLFCSNLRAFCGKEHLKCPNYFSFCDKNILVIEDKLLYEFVITKNDILGHIFINKGHQHHTRRQKFRVYDILSTHHIKKSF